MKTVTLSVHKEIQWPDKCAYCSTPADTFAEAKNVEATGFYLVAYTERTSSITFPVCKKHKKIAWLKGLFSRFGAVRGLIALILFPLLIWLPLALILKHLLGLDGPALGAYTQPLAIFLYVAFFSLSIYVYFKNPVKLIKNDGQNLSIRFTNDSYADEMESINS